MSILKYKYKAHRLVNTLFYVILFAIGFILGFGAYRIDLNKLISNVLMIENVQAYTIYEDEEKIINEEYIYNLFAENYENFNLDDFPYIHCEEHDYSTGFHTLRCHALNEKAFNQFEYNETKSSYYLFNFYHSNVEINVDYLSLTYDIAADVINKNESGSSYIFYYYDDSDDLTYTNYDIEIDEEIRSDWNLLDFNGTNLQFNENLFKDNPDFKEVCVNNYDTFSITSNQIQDYDDNNNPVFHDFDFIWFPHGLAYLSVWQYDSSSPTHVTFYDNNENSFVGWGYWLDTKEEIDKHFGNDNPGMYLELKGYKDKYSYYNWTFYPFEITFTTDYHFYSVFSFDSSYLKQAGKSTKVDHAYIEYLDGRIKEDSEKYCFYVKNEYDINILNKNENGDFNSSITILGGINRDDVTYESELGKNPDGFFSTVNNFISKIRPAVIFINTYILEFYTSMPLIVRSFILSFLVLIIIRILIGMVVR